MISVEELQSHKSFKLIPTFSRSYSEFKTFLDITKVDLQEKKESLESERDSLKSGKGLANRRIRNYLACQLYMIGKHVSRLEGFEREITDRLQEILGSVEEDEKNCECDTSRNNELIETEISLQNLELNEKEEHFEHDLPEILIEEAVFESQRVGSNPNSVTVDERELLDQVENLKTEASSPPKSDLDNLSCHSGSNSTSDSTGCHMSEDSFDSNLSSNGSSPKNSLPGGNPQSHGDEAYFDQRMKLLKLSADMKRMKRRIKHILDVTDRYCVVQKPPEEISEPDGISLLHNERAKTPHRRSPLPDTIGQNLVRSTIESFGQHLAVIAKTYTRRHSSELDLEVVKSPSEVSP